MAKCSVADLPGLGPKSAQALQQIGVETVEEFRRADAFELYRQLKSADPSTSLNFLYAMLGAQQNCRWQTIKREQKTSILLRLEQMGLAPK